MPMWIPGAATALLWRSAYRRVVLSAFNTVPFYRERWALDGRTDPALVPDRTGAQDGAISTDEITHKMADLVPLVGGPSTVDPARGLGHVLAKARRVRPGTLVVVVDPAVPRSPADLPRGLRGCSLDPEILTADGASSVRSELSRALRLHEPVLAVGPDKALESLSAALPTELGQRLDRLPHRDLDQLDGGPYGVLHDALLGYLGAFQDCGRWHLDWRRVFARQTKAGLAFTLLTQRSPRLVDVLVGGGVRGRIEPCPRHGTPVVLT